MANKTYSLKITGEKATLDAGLLYFAKANGYQEKVFNEEGVEVDNPVPVLEFAGDVLKNHIRANVVRYVSKQASRESAIAASEQITAGLDTLSTTVE